MRIDGAVVPGRILDTYRAWIDLIEERSVLAHARMHREVSAGFRITEANAAPLRESIRRLLNREDPPDWVLELLRGAGLYQKFTVVLSGMAIASAFDDWAAFLGEPSFVGAALLDPREDVRKLALKHVAEHPTEDPFADSSRTGTANPLREQFQWFLEIAAPLCVEVEPDAAEHGRPTDDSTSSRDRKPASSATPEPARLNGRLEAAEERLRQTIIKHREQAAIARQRNAQRLKEAENALRHKIAAWNRERDRLRSDARLNAEALDRLNEDIERRVEAEVAARMDDLRRGWLARPVACETAAAGLAARLRNGDDPLEIARQVLGLQVAAEQHDAARQQIVDRVYALRGLLDRVSDARARALQPLPALAQVARALEAELAQCLGSLGERVEHPSPLASRLQQALNTAPDLDTLAKAAQLVGQVSAYDLLSPDEHGELLVTEHRRRAFLYDQAGTFDKDAANARASRVPSHSEALTAQLDGTAPLAVLIDGHNLLLSVPRFRECFDDARPDAAYEQLEDLLRTCLANPGPLREIRVVLDGPVANTNHVGTGLQFIYSGGKGSDRADHVIVNEQLPALLHAPGKACVWVVSGDTAVVREAREAGVRTLHPRLFDLLLG